MFITNCPRCGAESLELLFTYSHCIECGYSPVDSEESKTWRRLEFRSHKNYPILPQLQPVHHHFPKRAL